MHTDIEFTLNMFITSFNMIIKMLVDIILYVANKSLFNSKFVSLCKNLREHILLFV